MIRYDLTYEIDTTSATFRSCIQSQLNLGGGKRKRDADKYFYRRSNGDPHSPSLITQNTRLSRPVIGRVLTNMFSKRTQMPHAIHAGRFSRLHFLEHHYTFVGDDYWWHRCRSIQRSQMARDRNYRDAPINYYQAVCHPHETINSVAPVHRRADKLSRPAARASLRAHTHPPSPLLFYVHIFFQQYSRRYLTTGRLMKILSRSNGAFIADKILTWLMIYLFQQHGRGFSMQSPGKTSKCFDRSTDVRYSASDTEYLSY